MCPGNEKVNSLILKQKDEKLTVLNTMSALNNVCAKLLFWEVSLQTGTVEYQAPHCLLNSS